MHKDVDSTAVSVIVTLHHSLRGETYQLQGHKVQYDDGDCHQENLKHRTYRLPGLAGSKVFNLEADAKSPLVLYTPPSSGVKSGTALIGQRVEIWWAQDEAFYPGVVKSYKKVQWLMSVHSHMLHAELCVEGFAVLSGTEWASV